MKDGIVRQYGIGMFEKADEGLGMWVRAADEEKAGRGRLIGRKTSRHTRFSV